MPEPSKEKIWNRLIPFFRELKLFVIHIKQLMQFHWMHYFSEDPQIFILSKNLPFRDILLVQIVDFIRGYLSGSTTERIKIAERAEIVKRTIIFNGKRYGKRPKRTNA